MKRTRSAGGVVVNPLEQVLIVSQKNSWSLPKGHIDPGEDKLTAAKREVYEETGIKQLELIKELGTYQRYKIGLAADDNSELKTITIFLFKTTQMELGPLDPKHPEARWVDKDQAVKLLTHPKDKEFFRAVLPDLG